MSGRFDGHDRLVGADYENWLKWWRATGRADLEDILLRRWDPLGSGSSDAVEHRDICARYATRIGMRLRHGISGAEIADLLVAASGELGVRVDERRSAAVAMEIRTWYRDQRGDQARTHWPMRFTREEI
ncbi:hypothetical protein OJ998_02495 [Solirubrobacter taibaiensis]|nr:hypothetical protein [Solirubrobacter taibaiensis]